MQKTTKRLLKQAKQATKLLHAIDEHTLEMLGDDVDSDEFCVTIKKLSIIVNKLADKGI